MSKFPDTMFRIGTPLIAALLAAPMALADDPAQPRDGGFGLGRAAAPEEVALWDIDIRPEGIDRWPVLAGGEGTLANDRPVKTVGSYWPYLSTVYDYVNRAMPFGYSQSLTPDDIYAITAYLLYSNYLVEDDFVLSNENFTDIRLPNEPGFFMDDRAEVELPLFSGEVCMENCKDSVEITARAMVLDVTPEDGAAAGGID